MSRFWLTNLIALPTFLVIGYFMSGWPRMGLFTLFWIVYLTLIGCGIAYLRMQFFGPVILRGKPGRMSVALTFDDGPDSASTPALLELLQKENIPAAFFCIGKNVEANPDIARQIVAKGHVLENHTFNHAWNTPLMRSRRLLEEISAAQTIITQTTGIAPIYMRPPVGHTNPHYHRVLKKLGLKLVGWDVRSMDTVWPTDKVIQRVLTQARDGSIILLHDGGRDSKQVIEIVTAIIAGLRQRNFEFARLDQLIEDTSP
jgi:peptidoglycan/xylan/chitin deacetylase (PgdA/CDA1 family)